jgi:AcrR family transcriptional regulator
VREQSAESEPGLRQRKKQRTRETITRVALELFAQQGFRTTTLNQIAEAAEIAPSTLYTYFRTKDEILFSPHDEALASIRMRVVGRPADETAAEAIRRWISDTQPELVRTASKERQAIIDDDPELRNSERLRFALTEDEFAKAFAIDLGKHPHELEPRLMASVVMNGLLTIWDWWFPQQADGAVNAHQLSELEITYVMSLIQAAEDVLKALRTPTLVLAAAAP